MFLLANNLIRTIMFDAADRHNVPLERISFKATMTAIETGGFLPAKARTPAERETFRPILLSLNTREKHPARQAPEFQIRPLRQCWCYYGDVGDCCPPSPDIPVR